jgi:penicillin-binding protein 2
LERMVRREALSILLGASALRAARIEPFAGAALLVDVRTRRVLASHNEAQANRAPAPPGSTIKPFALAALLKRGKLGARESFGCPGELSIGGRSFNCSHPRMESAMRVETALAYSCNCFVARMAERFEPGELARELTAAGLTARAASTVDAIRLQALGEEGVSATLAELATAYRFLALSAAPPILEGLEGAVEFGTAQRAQVAGVKVAGKTGSARMAWFAGFMPSRAPEVVVAVMLQGRSGGSDAAPIAGRILEAYRAGTI